MRSSPFAFYAAFAAGRSVVGFRHAESLFSGNENNKAQRSTVDHQNDPTIFVPPFLVFRPTFRAFERKTVVDGKNNGKAPNPLAGGENIEIQAP
jgi:hypothetical protein